MIHPQNEQEVNTSSCKDRLKSYPPSPKPIMFWLSQDNTDKIQAGQNPKEENSILSTKRKNLLFLVYH